MIKVSEIFTSIQGEGNVIGLPSVFLRLSGCNLKCRYCDTKFSWKSKKIYTIEEISETLITLGIKTLTITGGEPLIQSATCIKLIKAIRQHFNTIVIETNGIIRNEEDMKLLNMVDVVSLSLKTQNFIGRQIKYEEILNNVKNIKANLYIKLVFTKEDTIEDIKRLIKKIKESTNSIDIILQPSSNFRRKEEFLRFVKKTWREILKDDFISNNAKIIPQLHKLVFWRGRKV
ncbi:MAG: 7-carboxy-7-deazaguanine synthase QueE [candidate division WOR-3 bacterium]